MITEIKSNELTIIGSGNVTNYDSDSKLSFRIEIEKETFEVIFSFINDTTDNVKLETKVHENQIILECTNFKNPLGAGTTKAIEIAKIKNKKLFINFNVSKLTNGPQNLNYTFYLKN